LKLVFNIKYLSNVPKTLFTGYELNSSKSQSTVVKSIFSQSVGRV